MNARRGTLFPPANVRGKASARLPFTRGGVPYKIGDAFPTKNVSEADLFALWSSDLIRFDVDEVPDSMAKAIAS